MTWLMDRLADMDTRLKMVTLFFVLSLVPAGTNLMFLYYYPSKEILPFAVLYLVLLIVVQFPLCGWLSSVMVLRNMRKINEYCQGVKRGMYHVSFSLPPEKGEENDFLRAKRNLYWMGQVIAAREEKLVNSFKALNHAKAQIMESIEYAGRIQHTLLPPASLLEEAFEDYFAWWEPRDVVGGDTYWVAPTHDGYFAAAIDCTGHGVPGAFMTLIVHGLLERCAGPQYGSDPGLVLQQMNILLRTFLGRNGAAGELDDGFDAAICHINTRCSEVTFAGAGLPLFYRANGEICEIRGDRMGVGDSRAAKDWCYTNHTVRLEGPVQFYLATDGVMDQVGGRKRLPFGKNRLKSLLEEVSGLPFAEQQRRLAASWRTYAEHEETRDDITLLGFSVPKR